MSTMNVHRRAQSAVVLEDSRYLGSVHTYHEEEKEGLVDYVNTMLQGDPQLSHILPINPKSNDIFTVIQDGAILCQMINAIRPNSLPKMNSNKEISIFEKGERLILVLQTCQQLFNLPFVNIGVEDLLQGSPLLVLSVLWQLINIDIRNCLRKRSRLYDYLRVEVEVEENNLSFDETKILLSWFNHHLQNAGIERRVTNLSSDIKDSVAYLYLLNQLYPKRCTLQPLMVTDLKVRAEMLLQEADKVGCKKFVSAMDIVQGESRLNFAFLANLFTTFQTGPTPSDQANQLLEEQTSLFQDASKEARDNDSKTQEAESGLKGGREQLVLKKVELEAEKEKREERLVALEAERTAQISTRKAELEKLHQKLEEAKKNQLPTSEELLAAIKKEESIQEQIYKERETMKAEIAALKEEAQVKSAARKQEEEKHAKVTKEIQTMEDTHQAKTKDLKERIDAVGITSLQKKLDDAILQTKSLAASQQTMTNTRDSMVTKIETEGKEKNRASYARRKVEAELERAKAALAATTKSSAAVGTAVTKLEKKVIEIKTETAGVKKDTIAIEHTTSQLKEDVERTKDEVNDTLIQRKRLETKKSILENEVNDLEEELEENEDQTKEEIERVTTKRKAEIETNRLRQGAEIKKQEKENLEANLSYLRNTQDLAHVQVTRPVEEGLNELQKTTVRNMEKELYSIEEHVEATEMKSASIKRIIDKTNQAIEEEEEIIVQDGADIIRLKKEKKGIVKDLEKRHAEHVALETNTKILEREANLKKDEADNLVVQTANLKRAERDLEAEIKAKNDILESVERKRNKAIEKKTMEKQQSLEKEKEADTREVNNIKRTIDRLQTKQSTLVLQEEADESMRKIEQQDEQLRKQHVVTTKKVAEARNNTAETKEELKEIQNALDKAKSLIKNTQTKTAAEEKARALLERQRKNNAS